VEASVTEHAHRGLLLVPLPLAGGRTRVSLVAAVAVVLAQIAYPLLSGTALTAVTVLTVVLFAGAGVAHAATTAGPVAALRLLLAAGGISLVAEAIGLHTGYPFGRYGYASSLGAVLFGVPLVVLLAWTMMAYPALLSARRLAAVPPRTAPSRALVAGLGGITLAAWDLFLDPQMVAGGFWTWRYPDPGLPGVPGVPLTNLAGWLLVGTALTAVLDRLLPTATDSAADQVVPAALLTWTWLGSTLANLAFFGRPALAGYGFLALGVTVAPYLAVLVRDLRRERDADRGNVR
jgi:uncharacterized membrane protein